MKFYGNYAVNIRNNNILINKLTKAAILLKRLGYLSIAFGLNPYQIDREFIEGVSLKGEAGKDEFWELMEILVQYKAISYTCYDYTPLVYFNSTAKFFIEYVDSINAIETMNNDEVQQYFDDSSYLK